MQCDFFLIFVDSGAHLVFVWCGGLDETVGVGGVNTCAGVNHLLKFRGVSVSGGIEPKGATVEEHYFGENVDAGLVWFSILGIVVRGCDRLSLVRSPLPLAHVQ